MTCPGHRGAGAGPGGSSEGSKEARGSLNQSRMGVGRPKGCELAPVGGMVDVLG